MLYLCYNLFLKAGIIWQSLMCSRTYFENQESRAALKDTDKLIYTVSHLEHMWIVNYSFLGNSPASEF